MAEGGTWPPTSSTSSGPPRAPSSRSLIHPRATTTISCRTRAASVTHSPGPAAIGIKVFLLGAGTPAPFFRGPGMGHLYLSRYGELDRSFLIHSLRFWLSVLVGKKMAVFGRKRPMLDYSGSLKIVCSQCPAYQSGSDLAGNWLLLTAESYLTSNGNARNARSSRFTVLLRNNFLRPALQSSLRNQYRITKKQWRRCNMSHFEVKG